MPVAFLRPTRRIGVAVTTGLTAAALVACSEGEEPAVTPAETTTPVETPPTEESTSPTDTTAAEPPEGGDETTSEATTTTEEDRDADSPRADIEEAQETFGVLAPDSLWEQFEECNATGLEGSYECTGADVGSFQFFESRSKAASTTQLLTELRSSQVVEDTGRFVVGWSTLGTTAVITVVDNDEGLVMQQLVSSDIVEPEDRIEELGLDNPSDWTREGQDSDDSGAASESSDSSPTTTTSAASSS